MKKLKTIIISKSNALIKSSYKLSPLENIILLYCIGHIKTNKKINEKNEFLISLSDVGHMMDSKNAFENLKKASVRLYNRNIIFSYEPETETKKITIHSSTRWIILRGYNEEHSVILVAFSNFIIPYLTELSKCYTKYKFTHILHMKSFYGMRLYELIMSWYLLKEKEVSITWLRQRLQIPEGQYSRLYDFKKYIINKALNDINHENCDLWAKAEYRTTGKPVTHIIFIFGKKKKSLSQTIENKKITYDIPFHLFKN